MAARVRRSIPALEIRAAAKVLAVIRFNLDGTHQYESLTVAQRRECKVQARRILLAADAVRTM